MELKANYNRFKKIGLLLMIVALIGVTGCSKNSTEKANVNIRNKEDKTSQKSDSTKFKLWEIVDHEPDREKLDVLDLDYVVVYAEIINSRPVMDNLLLRYEDGGTSIGDKYYIDEYRLECIGYKICACRYRKVDGKVLKEVMYEDADIERDHWVQVKSLRSDKG